MRDIVFAAILGNALGMSLMSGAESVQDGGKFWILELIVFPLAAAVGIVSLLLQQKRSGRRPIADARSPRNLIRLADHATC